MFGAALPAGRLGDCRVWRWNGVELIVTQPFDPCKGLPDGIEEALISSEKPHALRLGQRHIGTVVCGTLMLTRQVEGVAGDAREVAPDNGILRKIGECHSSVLLTQPLPRDGYLRALVIS